MFTKEHFEKVAQVLSDAQRATCNDDFELREQIVSELAGEFADIFAESNPRFSKRAFIGACNAASRSEIRRLVQSNNKRLAS